MRESRSCSFRSLATGAALLTAAVLAAAWLGAMPGRAGGACSVPAFTYRHGIVTFSEHGQSVSVRVEIADTPEKQEVGLMCRTALSEDAGMLFAFADTTRTPFWMKNTLIPLTIAFLDPRWRIVGILDMRVAPDPASDNLPLYAPRQPYRYALEVNQGFFARHSLDQRAQVQFVPDPAR